MKFATAVLIAVSMLTSTAMAQSPAPAAAPAKGPVARTAKSLDCSKQADSKSLHGKPRKHFMSTCKKA